MPKIKCELEVSHEQLDEIRSTIEKFAPKAEAQPQADNSAMVKCPFYKYTSDECKMGFGDKCKPVACKLQRALHQ